MGNGGGCGFRSPGREQLITYLNNNQIRLIQKTWILLRDDLSILGVMIFKQFFEKEKDLKMLFPKIVLINDNNQLEYDTDTEMLQKHAMTVMGGLRATVESLEDSEHLSQVLFDIGKSHTYKSVKPSMLKRLWPSMNFGLRMLLEENYTREVEAAWKKIYSYMCAQMINGMCNASKRHRACNLLGECISYTK